MFNTNQKNFFKFRKDIIEEPENEDEESNDDLHEKNNIVNEKKNKINHNNNKKEKNSIQFPEIYKYFLKFS